MAYIDMFSAFILLLVLTVYSDASNNGEPIETKGSIGVPMKLYSAPCQNNKGSSSLCGLLIDNPKFNLEQTRSVRRRRSNMNAPVALPRTSGVISTGRRRRRCSWFRRLMGRC